ncbi:MAG: hypothetical protein COT89_01840 [Candidatus Colwellbacteria bacterium CG10_big_fil_rev_8_21_14_0_10_42_22]|uniref:5'-3' exonuclease domain-containing protein n=1 Tax=Candidatus Colwellbacteria bacterium CG10_big_fil_rev_8_21_14_0_10_42_22 TaxID=1974540 RepID=A0A2H0VFS8_9BACT|nr:MAG: hypothetical protein COT89_01840 [Candidatus Colwellbacteria bacterium CG10_big_fil_rev_8_21_14_0_10_42_22]
MEKEKQKEELLLIDANSIIYRAYHALPPLTGPSGRPTGALYGLASILIKLLKDGAPLYAAAAFDRPEPTFRKEKYDDYKATRPPTPDDLIPQLHEAKNMLQKFGIQTLEAPGFEADDILATLADKFHSEVDKTIILSGDLDTLQLVRGDRVVAEVPKRGISETKIYNTQEVFEKYGIKPEQMADYKGLVGDKSDNIPGVPGIGPKTASNLLQKYKDIETIYKKLEDIHADSSTLVDKLEQNKEQAFLSKELAVISKEAPTPNKIDELKTNTFLEDRKLHEYLEGLGFKTILKRIIPDKERESSKIGKLF